MRIRNEQLDEIARGQFHERLLDFLRANLPRETAQMRDEALLQEIAAGERKAAQYGVTGRRAVAQFLILRLAAGQDFDESPAVQSYLQLPNLDPDHTVGVLLDTVIEQLRGKGRGDR